MTKSIEMSLVIFTAELSIILYIIVLLIYVVLYIQIAYLEYFECYNTLNVSPFHTCKKFMEMIVVALYEVVRVFGRFSVASNCCYVVVD